MSLCVLLQASLVLGEALEKDGDNPYTQFMAYKLAMAQGNEDKGGSLSYVATAQHSTHHIPHTTH